MPHRPLLFFVVEHSLSDRDFERFGLSELSSDFLVEVIDTSERVSRTPDQFDHGLRIHFAPTPLDIEFLIQRSFPRVIISNLGAGKKRNAAFTAGRCMGTLLVEFQLGLTPGDLFVARSILSKTLRRIRQAPSSLDLFASLLRRLAHRDEFHERAEFKIVGGRAAKELAQRSGMKTIDAHSHDFNLVMASKQFLPKSNPSRPYAVYLDQDMGFHPDYEVSQLRVPIKVSEFYPNLLDYFDEFSRATGLEVVISPHPKCDFSRLNMRFPNHRIASESTCETIRSSACVLSHNSTAVSFAVAWGKPLVLLADQRLIRSWEGPFVLALAKTLEAPIDFIDSSQKSFGMPLSIHSEKYDLYINQYMSELPHEERSTWAIATRRLREELNARVVGDRGI
jgi:hypothetical protein